MYKCNRAVSCQIPIHKRQRLVYILPSWNLQNLKLQCSSNKFPNISRKNWPNFKIVTPRTNSDKKYQTTKHFSTFWIYKTKPRMQEEDLEWNRIRRQSSTCKEKSLVSGKYFEHTFTSPFVLFIFSGIWPIFSGVFRWHAFISGSITHFQHEIFS